MERVDLLTAFNREVEVLELNDDYMIYALDQKNELKDLCSIEKMDFSDRQIQRLISLDYTRLWESFRTYGQLPEFFYAVNVLQDYRVRLRKINKQTWENDTDFLIQPEGEIINIYSLNEDYMVITDEVKASADVYKKYHLTDEGRRYVNVRYLYEIATAKKYPIVDSHFDSLTEELPVRQMDGVPTLIYEAFYRDEADENAGGMSAILAVPVDAFIAHVKADGLAGFKVLAMAGEDGFAYVRLMSASDDRIIYRRRKIELAPVEAGKLQEAGCHTQAGELPAEAGCAGGTDGNTGADMRWALCNALMEQQVVLHGEADGSFTREIRCEYRVPEMGSLHYDNETMDVYHCPDGEDAKTKHIYCLNRPDVSLAYDGKYGDFCKLWPDELLVTTYFDEVFVKEYEYHEYSAIHDLKSGTVDTIEGRTEASDQTLVLLRSFLAL